MRSADAQSIGFGEFVALMAMMMSLVALSIDAMLPALTEIGTSLGVRRANDNQLILSLLFLGMSVGQMVYGPLSDSIGRKPAMHLGLGLFMAGCLLSLCATSYTWMLAGRLLQGFGVAAPRIVSMALVRDQYSGRGMARVMSFVMSLFIMVPVVAPLLGQLMLIVADWRAIFGAILCQALIATVWFALRHPETLTTERRVPFSLARLAKALREMLAIRRALGFTLVIGLVSGAFLGYLNSAQQIFQQLYGVGRRFPFYFAALALAVGCALFFNGRLVMRFGMRRLTRAALMVLGLLSLSFWGIAWWCAGQPPLWALMSYLLMAFFCIGVQFGNLNALAMEPLGHIAGLGAAMVGSLGTFIALLLGALIGQSYSGTVLPLLAGFTVLSAASLAVMRWVDA
jgi:DHA1 family bicyclomycin/chloramphenicol resistance-like MFS transporter